MKHLTAENPAFALTGIPSTNSEVPAAKLDQLMADLQELIDELFNVRTSIDAGRKSA